MMKNLMTVFLIAGAAAMTSAADIALKSSRDLYAGKPASAVLQVPGGAGKPLSWGVFYLGAKASGGVRTIPAAETVTLECAFPTVKTGVVAETSLTCSAAGMTMTTPLRFYPENPFADQKDFLQKMGIAVLDLDKDNRLTKLLTKLEVPFNPIANLSEFAGKTLLVSGIDFSDFSGVGEDLRKIAEKGALVVIMPPITGTLPLDLNRADQVTLGTNAQILTFDKKLDAKFWGSDVPAATTIRLGAEDVKPTLAVDGAGQSRLTFCQARYGRGAVIVTTWNIVGKAEVSPTPVHLLAKMFERFDYLAFPEKLVIKANGEKMNDNARVIELLK